MCVGKKDKGSASTAVEPKPRVDPVSPQSAADALKDPFGALSAIAGVHTSSRGVTNAANRGEVHVNGPGSANKPITFGEGPKGPPGRPAPPWQTPTTTTPEEVPTPEAPTRPGPRGGGGERPNITPGGGLGFGAWPLIWAAAQRKREDLTKPKVI